MRNVRQQLRETIRAASGYDEKLRVLQESIAIAKKEHPNSPIRYVSGKITADGKEHIAENLTNMGRYTEQLEQQFDHYAFSAEDLFDQAYWEQDTPPELKELDEAFWVNVLKSSITDIYMSPGWEHSNGAKNERAFAQAHGINVHDDMGA